MSISSILGQFKTAAQEKADILRDLQHNQVAQRYAPDWMKETEEITGKPCTSWEQIAWDDPEISLQYWLCDPVHVRHIKQPKHRAAALATLTEAQLKIYYTVRDGHSYSELEKHGWKESVVRAVMSHRRLKKEQDEQENQKS